MADKLMVVIPCYNEEQVLPITAPMFLQKITSLTEKGMISDKSRVLFVNDGSSDRTWDIIKEANFRDERFAGLCLDQNRGHQTALTEGLMCAKDKRAVSVSIDADLQDDVNAIYGFLEKYREGCDVVYGCLLYTSPSPRDTR